MVADKVTARRDIEFRREADDLVFTWPGYKLTATFSRLRPRGDGLAGELLLTHEIAGRIHWGQLALASVSARKTLADKLKRELGPENGALPNWSALLDNLCYMGAEEFRRDGAFVQVGSLDDDDGRDEYLVPPLLLAGELNLIYGQSGTGKGYLYAGLMLHAADLPCCPYPLHRRRRGPPCSIGSGPHGNSTNVFGPSAEASASPITL